MIDLSSLQLKIDTLSSATEAKAITPETLAGVFTDIIELLGQVDNSASNAATIGAIKRVVLFSGTVAGVVNQTAGTTKTSTSQGCSVVYDTIVNRFLLKDGFNYYGTFGDGHVFGSGDANGVKPYAEALYIHPASKSIYHFDGTALSKISTGLTLGTGAGDAFKGSDGVALQTALNDLKETAKSDVLALEDVVKRNKIYVGELEGTLSNSINRLDGAIAAITDSKGVANGIAPLNASRVIDKQYLPAEVNAAVEASSTATITADTAVRSANLAAGAAQEAKNGVTANADEITNAKNRIKALEDAKHFEEITSEEVWQARKDEGSLKADTLYYIPE